MNGALDGVAWAKEIKNEHDQMVKKEAWEPVKKNSLPRGTKVIDSTGVCKKESTGKLCGRLTHADSSKWKVCTTADQVPRHQPLMPVPYWPG